MDGFALASFTEMVVFYFPRVVMLLVGVAVGIALYDTLKPSPPPFGRLVGRAASMFSGTRR